MALLTKQERRNLNPEERRALRAERRAERPKKGIKININWDGLLAKAQDMMLDLVADDIPGPDKMDEVLQMLADEADDFLTWNNLGVVGLALEAVDGPIIAAIFGGIVKPQMQKLYDEMVADGRIQAQE